MSATHIDVSISVFALCSALLATRDGDENFCPPLRYQKVHTCGLLCSRQPPKLIAIHEGNGTNYDFTDWFYA
jgi:hypothetical protein